MSITTCRSWRAAGVTLLAVALSLAMAPPAGAAPRATTFAKDFIAPLGLAVGQDGTVYVADSFAGQLVSIDRRGRRTTLLAEEGAFFAGIDAVGRGNVVWTQTLPPEFIDPEVPPEEQPDAIIGRIAGQGRSTVLASLLAFEQRHNPDGGQTYGFTTTPSAACVAQLPPWAPTEPYTGIVESNPYAVAIDGGSYLVADAAGNTIVRVSANGKRLSTVAVLPPVRTSITAEYAASVGAPACAGLTYLAEPVPTDVEIGPDGHYYVSSLPGFPEAPGTGTVFRIDSRTGAVRQVATGFNGAVDLAVGRDGTIYVAELGDFTAGRVTAIRGGRTSVVYEPTGGGAVTAVELSRDGTLYLAVVTFDEEFNPSGRIVTLRP